jgi:hypothetical protein
MLPAQISKWQSCYEVMGSTPIRSAQSLRIAMKDLDKKLSVIVVVSDSGMEHFQNVVTAVKAKGLEVAHAFEFTGVITGSILKSKMLSLVEVEGVLSVEEDLNVGI